MSQPIALIVEDRPEIARIWGMHLEKLDIKTAYAATWDAAQAALKRIPPPDLVLLDLNLSTEHNAPFIVQQISFMKSYNPDMIVIVISGVLTPELAQIAVSQGANAVREKMDMQAQRDLWGAIEESLSAAPQQARGIFAHPLELITQLANKFTK